MRYVVEGSVRKASDRLRVTAKLTDAVSGNTVWAERYDSELLEQFCARVQAGERGALRALVGQGGTPIPQRRASASGTSMPAAQ